MATFPTTFSRSLELPGEMPEFVPEENPWIGQLATKGVMVAIGLRTQDVPPVAAIAAQPSIREFCPKDVTERWGDVDMARRKLAAGTGRAVFLLIDFWEHQIAGYGWVGSQQCEELPDCDTTFAVRLSKSYQGRRLAVPFTRGIVAASRIRFGAANIGLETWGSNTGAVTTYARAGARLVTSRDSERPTPETGPFVVDGKRQDVRLYMQFDQ